MAVPKRRTSKAARDKRRSHIKTAKAPRMQYCVQCSEVVLPHRICANCGHYARPDEAGSRFTKKEKAKTEEK